MVWQIGPLPASPPGQFSQFGSVQGLQNAEKNTTGQTTPSLIPGGSPVTGLPGQGSIGNPVVAGYNTVKKVGDVLKNTNDIISAFTLPNAPAILSPNEIFDPIYWQVLAFSATQEANPTVINSGVLTNEETYLAQKYGLGGPSNYRTILGKFGTEILFGLIFLILIYAFVTDKGE